MKFLGVTTLVLALVAFPAAASSDSTTKRNASKICKGLRADMGKSVFKQTYGTNKNRRNAHGKCVSKQVRLSRAARRNAAKSCKAMRADDPAGFAKQYKNLGKCVSSLAKEQVADENDATENAAKECKSERGDDHDAFEEKYGTNKNKSNAFGKCVSEHADDDAADDNGTGGGTDDGPNHDPNHGPNHS